MSEQTTDLVDVSGVVRFRGHFVPPIGGSPPKYGVYGGLAEAPYVTTIANGASAELPWSFANDGEELLDLTDPLNPTVVEGGVYAVDGYAGLWENGGSLTPGGVAQVRLYVAGEFSALIPGGVVGTQFLLAVGLSNIGKLEAGESISCVVANDDGVAAHDFRIGAFYVLKLA